MSKARGLADLGNVYNDGALSNRNLVINGAMNVAQRGTSSTGVTTSGYKTCDRFEFAVASLGTWTVSQESDGPSGFANSLKVACTTANASPAGDAYLFLNYTIEGQDLQQLAKGTADAKPMMLSFWVKSNKTGTYQVSLIDNDNSRTVAGTYTVDTSAIWEHKTIAVPSDTIGAFDNDVNAGLNLEFWLDSGANLTGGAVPTAWEPQLNIDRNAGSNVNLADTLGNYFQITGVQLEVGDTATPFEHRSYGQELALCHRYYYQVSNDEVGGVSTRYGYGHAVSTVVAKIVIPIYAQLRTKPTISYSSVPILSDATVGILVTFVELEGGTSNSKTVCLTVNVAGGLTQFRPYFLEGGGGTPSVIKIDAEL